MSASIRVFVYFLDSGCNIIVSKLKEVNMIICDKQVDIFRCGEPNVPLIILNTFGGEGQKVYSQALLAGSPKFDMAAVSGIDWNNELSPWASEKTAEGESSFGGGADEYLDVLCEKIIPSVTENIGAKPKYIAQAGYSLAGLFAVYSLYRTDMFSAAVSASGSFWYPGFISFAQDNSICGNADCVYFSLGDREKFTSNERLCKVQECTEQMYMIYGEKGIRTVFELNKGNHFKQTDMRTAKGIKWLLENKV